MGLPPQTQEHREPARRFRINPVELAVFSVVTMIFISSVYNLIYDRPGFRPTALSPMSANPLSEGRSPASAQTQNFANIEFSCQAADEMPTAASKARLSGAFCGRSPAGEGAGSERVLKVTAVNSANRFQATVFSDTAAAKFSTDYIPLNSGRNPIVIEFHYSGGRRSSHEVVIHRN